MNSRGKLGVSALAIIALIGCTAFATVADAAKKHPTKKNPNVARPIGTTGAVPDGPSSRSVPPTPFVGTATVGKKGKGKIVDDIDITISISAVPAPDSTNAMRNLRVRLTGPSGATTDILTGGKGVGTISGTLVSNLTLSDETPIQTCGGAPTPPPPPCNDPFASLLAPFTGTAEPNTGAMSTLYGYKMRGTYTLTAWDSCGSTNPDCEDKGSSTITAWQLTVTGAKA